MAIAIVFQLVFIEPMLAETAKEMGPASVLGRFVVASYRENIERIRTGVVRISGSRIEKSELNSAII